MRGRMSYLNIGKAAVTVGIETSSTGVLAPVNVPLYGGKVNRFFDQLVVLWAATNSQSTLLAKHKTFDDFSFKQSNSKHLVQKKCIGIYHDY